MTTIQQETAHLDMHVANFSPVRILEIDLDHPLPPLSAYDEKKIGHYQAASCLIRLHTQPLGLVNVSIERDVLRPDEYVQKIWDTLHVQINEHLRQDCLPQVTELTIYGLPTNGLCPLCVEEREKFLTEAPFVSVIVPTHDRPEQLAKCLHSLLTLEYPQYEIIVVDNAPNTNDTAELVQKLAKDSHIVRYVIEDNPGRSWARNRGITAAKGEILAFADDDVVVDTYWLAELVRSFGLAENVVCVTGLVLPMELDTPAQVWFEEYGGFNKGYVQRIFKHAKKERYPDMPLFPYMPGRLGTGASMAFTAKFLHKVNGFDPAFGGSGKSINGQDIALFLKVLLDGHTLIYQPRALLYHLHRRRYDALCKQIYHYGISIGGLLTKTIVERPLRLLGIMAKMPYGLFFVLSSQSSKNSKRSKNYPQELVILERKGMLYGPIAYLRSRREVHTLPRVECATHD